MRRKIIFLIGVFLFLAVVYGLKEGLFLATVLTALGVSLYYVFGSIVSGKMFKGVSKHKYPVTKKYLLTVVIMLIILFLVYYWLFVVEKVKAPYPFWPNLP